MADQQEPALPTACGSQEGLCPALPGSCSTKGRGEAPGIQTLCDTEEEEEEGEEEEGEETMLLCCFYKDALCVCTAGRDNAELAGEATHTCKENP